MGSKLVAARTGPAFCPVRMLELYISAIGASDRDYDEYIFRDIMYCTIGLPKCKSLGRIVSSICHILLSELCSCGGCRSYF